MKDRLRRKALAGNPFRGHKLNIFKSQNWNCGGDVFDFFLIFVPLRPAILLAPTHTVFAGKPSVGTDKHTLLGALILYCIYRYEDNDEMGLK